MTMITETVHSTERSTMSESSADEASFEELSHTSALDHVTSWIRRFEELLTVEPQERGTSADLFLANAVWRDIIAVSWDFHTVRTVEQIDAFIARYIAAGGLRRLAIAEGTTPAVVEHLHRRWLEAIVTFDTPEGRGRGVLRMLPADDGQWRVWTLSTLIDELRGHEAAVGVDRPVGVDRDLVGAPPWAEQRRAESEFEQDEPYVLVIGAGQNGLALAANLKTRGVPALVVERHPRVGDNWRLRYDTLMLHDPVWLNHLPFMPFPDSWPVYTAKDKLADWLESYARALDLNVWTGSTITDVEYSDETGRWAVSVDRPDGTTRVIAPTHVVLATGNQGVPVFPDIEGVENFAGTSYHSSEHRAAVKDAGEVVLVGAGTSALDIAKEYHEQGARVTMIQRSPTHVIAQRHMPMMTLNIYRPGGPPIEDADLRFASFSNPEMLEFATELTSRAGESEKDLHEALLARGFQLDEGPEGSGIMGKVLTKGGGYYIDVGTTGLIADGKIRIESGRGVKQVKADGVELDDGTFLPADTIVYATGFTGIGEMARRILTDEIIDRSGLPGGLDEEGEINRMWRPTGHPGLWFTGGSLQLSRVYSKFVAIQLAARYFGVIGGTK